MCVWHMGIHLTTTTKDDDDDDRSGDNLCSITFNKPLHSTLGPARCSGQEVLLVLLRQTPSRTKHLLSSSLSFYHTQVGIAGLVCMPYCLIEFRPTNKQRVASSQAKTIPVFTLAERLSKTPLSTRWKLEAFQKEAYTLCAEKNMLASNPRPNAQRGGRGKVLPCLGELLSVLRKMNQVL